MQNINKWPHDSNYERKSLSKNQNQKLRVADLDKNGSLGNGVQRGVLGSQKWVAFQDQNFFKSFTEIFAASTVSFLNKIQNLGSIKEALQLILAWRLSA